jgi:hypothetical protein
MLRAMRHFSRTRMLSLAAPSCSLVLLAFGCAHGSEQAAKPALRTSTETPQAAPESAPRVRRDFPRDALYRELVTAIDAENALGPSDAACLLARNEDGYRFAGEPAPAIHPLPESSDDLDDALRSGASLRVLTRHGSFGPEKASLGLAALTEAPPTRAATVLLVTDQAYYVKALSESAMQVASDAQEAAAQAKAHAQGGTLYVAAEGRVALSEVYDLLATLSDFPGPVVLAAPLPRDAVLPAQAKPSELPPRCPDGLPETDELSGDLPVAEISAGVAPLKERVPDCLIHADGPAAAGDRLTLAFRIDSRGQVIDACVVASESNDARLASCVLGLARELRFSAPSPRGVVDVELPLVVKPAGTPIEAPVCR